MSNSISKIDKMITISSKCKDKALMDYLIDSYQSSTKCAVENILNMSIAVNEIDKKRRSKELNEFDVAYFCATVNLDSKSSTFRKFSKIGAHANNFKKYIDRLPSAYTVLYQITTLDSDRFLELIESDKISPSLSLESLKKIISPQISNINVDNANFKVVFNTKEISDETKKLLRETISSLVNRDDLEILVSEKNKRYFGSKVTFTKSTKIGSWSLRNVNN